MIKFAYTILYVKDVLKTITFYEKAFGFKRKFIVPDNSYGELITGTTTLSFASTKLAKTNLKDGFIESKKANKPFAIEIAFATDNVEKIYKQAIKAGAFAEAEPTVKPHGQTVAYVRDIDGFLVEICTPME
jgi:lactoylglutathione lyase